MRYVIQGGAHLSGRLLFILGNDFCKGLATVKVLLQHWKQVFGIHYLRIKSRLEPQVIVIAQGGSVKVEACIQVESVRHGFRVGWHNIGNMAAKNSLPIIRSKKQEYWPPKLKAPEQIFSVQAEPRPGKECGKRLYTDRGSKLPYIV